MDEDTTNPTGAEGTEPEEESVDPDVLEDSFDDVDNL